MSVPASTSKSPSRSFSLSSRKRRAPVSGTHLAFGADGSSSSSHPAHRSPTSPSGSSTASSGLLSPPATSPTASPSIRRAASSDNVRAAAAASSPASSSSAHLALSSPDIRGMQRQPPHAQSSSPPPPPVPAKGDGSASHAALQSARLKLESQDQEAMRRVRSTLMETSDSGSSSGSSPRSPGFPGAGPAAADQPRVRPRRSTLSKQISADQLLAPADIDTDRTPRPDEARQEAAASQPLAATRPGAVDHVIAVVGHEGVGKTTVIRRALNSWGTSPPVSVTQDGHSVSSSFASVEPGGKLQHPCKVEFVEVDLRALDLSGVGPIFPSTVPVVSGVILCYDAARQDSLRGLSEALHLLAAGMPMVLFACKSDPGAVLEVEAAIGDSIGQPYNVGLIEVSTLSTQGKSKMRTGLRWLLYKLEQRRRRESRRAQFSGAINMRQALASSPGPAPTDSDASADHVMWRPGHAAAGVGAAAESDAHSSSSSLQWMMQSPIHGADASGATTAVSGETEETTNDSKADAAKAHEQPAEPPMYASLEDLFNKLFTAIVSTQDEAFIRAFFLTYRRFCQPITLINEFLSRYHEIELYPISKDVRHWALLKVTGALINWSSQYPGDFADEATLSVFRETLALVLKYTFMSHLTVDLISIGDSLLEATDLDASWSYRPSGSKPLLPPLPPTPPASSVTGSSAIELVLDRDVLYEIDSSTGTHMTKPNSAASLNEKAASTRTLSTTDLAGVEGDPYPITRTESVSSDPRVEGSATSHDSRSVHSHPALEDVSHARWSHAVALVVNSDARHFALELTRLQWELFADIRPRDVFRHDFGKEHDDPVGRAIAFFNHLSRWVSTVILAAPKPKHRARAYEAFVRVAHQLRRLNNYDSLYAVISGMRETSVHRLQQTHALVKLDPASARDFQSHLKLMDPRGGYVHYRRALQADISHGRGAIPLLTTILGLVNRLQVVRREDVRDDGMVQWDKFARFGEILSTIGECQAKGPIVRDTASVQFRRIIEDTPVITNEDGLFERSRILEPGAGGQHAGGGGGMLRKLAGLTM